jgi:hypothetical protein
MGTLFPGIKRPVRESKLYLPPSLRRSGALPPMNQTFSHTGI